MQYRIQNISRNYLIISIILLSPFPAHSDPIFLEDFEFSQMPWNYYPGADKGAVVELSSDKYVSGQTSLKLSATNPNGGCGFLIGLDMDYNPGIKIRLFQYFEQSFPFYVISVNGFNDENNLVEFSYEYGNSEQEWWSDDYFTLRGFTEIEKEPRWILFEADITNDIKAAINHRNAPFESFIPYRIKYLRLGLDGPDSESKSRIVYIDVIQIGQDFYEYDLGYAMDNNTLSSEQINKISQIIPQRSALASPYSIPDENIKTTSLEYPKNGVFPLGVILAISITTIILLRRKYSSA